MALSNSQYDRLMRSYEQRQLDNERDQRARYEEAVKKIPEIAKIDSQIASLSVSRAKALLLEGAKDIGNLKEEIAALSQKKKEALLVAGFPEDYLEEHYSCPDCKDTGYIGSEKCHCLKKAIGELLYTQSNLQGVLEEENFEHCSLDYYSSNHIDPMTGRSSLDAMKIALKTCRGFVDTFSTEFHNIYLYGDTGVGKTFLSHCVAKELMEQSRSVIYLTSDQLFKIFSKNVFGGRDEKEEEAYQYIYDCDLLIIDDLGTESPNSFTISQLFVCLNERILRKKSTMISTNLALEDIKNIYSERIFSRISSDYIILRLTGDDIRVQKKLLNLGGTKNVTT